MSSRSQGSFYVRRKVVALLLSLAALWTFAAFVTLRDGMNLLSVSTLTDSIGRPTEAVLVAIQQERRGSVVYLASPATDRAAQRAALAEQRVLTDREHAEFDRLAGGGSWAASVNLENRIGELSRLLAGLARQREDIDRNTATRDAVATAYTNIIDAGFRVYEALGVLDDEAIARHSHTLVALSRAREVVSQEDALLAGVLAAKRLTVAEHLQFIKLVGIQRFQYAEAASELSDAERREFAALDVSPEMAALRALEDRVVNTGPGPANTPPIDSATWDTAITAALSGLRTLEQSGAALALKEAEPAALGVIIRLILAGGLGLLAVVASIIMSITTARKIVFQLERLRDAADDLARNRLPGVVDKLSRGDTVDVEAEALSLEFGEDEIGQVGQAFNAVQRTAVRAAVEQAELRKNVRDVFLSLARRTQALVHRQLNLLDTMERHETEPDELRSLFRIDHLATRMRRNAENLIVLSGAATGRGWRHPVPMVDVIRGATAEIEDYTRVNVLPIVPAGLAGRAVGDIIHLLAELIENAASFSPPYTAVQVSGARVAGGFAVEIEDRGLGMTPQALSEANHELSNPSEFRPSNTPRLGLYVVGRLAERHGIRVHLRPSPYGGITAIVLIPQTLLTSGEDAQQSRQVAMVGVRSLRRGTLAEQDNAEARTGEPGAAALTGSPAAPDAPIGVPAVPPSRRLDAAKPEPVPAAPDPRAEAPGDTAPASAGEPETVFGLPRRRRHASTPEPTPAAAPPAPETPAPREPEKARALMNAYQRGTRRARSEAEQNLPRPNARAPHAAPAHGVPTPRSGAETDRIPRNGVPAGTPPTAEQASEPPAE